MAAPQQNDQYLNDRAISLPLEPTSTSMTTSPTPYTDFVISTIFSATEESFNLPISSAQVQLKSPTDATETAERTQQYHTIPKYKGASVPTDDPDRWVRNFDDKESKTGMVLIIFGSIIGMGIVAVWMISWWK